MSPPVSNIAPQHDDLGAASRTSPQRQRVATETSASGGWAVRLQALIDADHARHGLPVAPPAVDRRRPHG